MQIVLNEQGEMIPPVEKSLRSETMHELISRKPGFLTRWALFIFLLILLLMTTATWFVQFPDVITARATIIASNLPREILTRQEGRLVKLFVRNGDSVKAGDRFGYIESNAKHEHVILLNQKLDSTLNNLEIDNTAGIASHFEDNIDSLGELQQHYQQFMSAFQQYSDYIESGYYMNRKQMLSDDLNYLQKNREILQQQKELMQKDLKLSEETYAINEKLLKEKVIAKQDVRNEKSKLLGKQMTIPQANANLLANETQQREKKKEIAELEHTIALQKVLFQQQIQTLKSLIQEWIKRYVLSASINGQISFLLPLQEGRYYSANKLLGYINPATADYYAEVYLPQNNFGKVQKNQRVQLRFDAYPYNEFGFVNGQLSYITDFATDSGFLAQIKLPQGLLTSQHKKLHYRNGLKADARIITKDMRLFNRLFYDLKKVIDN